MMHKDDDDVRFEDLSPEVRLFLGLLSSSMMELQASVLWDTSLDPKIQQERLGELVRDALKDAYLFGRYEDAQKEEDSAQDDIGRFTDPFSA